MGMLTHLAIRVLIIWGFATLTARIIGTWQHPHSALAGFREGCDDQPQPCWQGIIPGFTTLNELDAILENKGYRLTGDGAGTLTYWLSGRLCSRVWVGYWKNTVTRLGMPVCDGARLGDLALVNDDFYTVTQSGLTMMNGKVVVGLPAGGNGSCMVLKPHGQVTQIWLSSEKVTYKQPIIPLWRGYLPFGRYRKWYALDCRPLGMQPN